MMNKNYIRIMSSRLHLLESVVKRQERIQKNKSAGILNGKIFFTDSKNGGDEEWFSNKSYVNEIRFIDVNDRFSSIGIKNIGTNKSTIQISDTTSPELPTPSCLMEIKHNLLYNILWVLVNIFSISVSCFYIKTAYDTWKNSPIIEVISNNQVRYENISFPAVTICWPPKFKREYNFFKNIENCLDCENHKCILKSKICNSTEIIKLLFAQNICQKYFQTNPLPRTIDKYFIETLKEMDRNEFNTIIEKLLPSCDSDWVMTNNAFGGLENYTRCNGDMFQQFYSRRNNRICMTYNSLRHKDILEDHVVTPIAMSKCATNTSLNANPIWSFENMMEFKGGLDTVPIYGKDRLAILIYQRENSYEQICKDEDSVAYINLHSPNEIPMEGGDNEFRISDNYFTEVLFEPKITLARDLAQYPPHRRGCLFAHENKLAMFKYYTKNNCYLECLIDSYLKSCGCVPHMYLRHNDSVKACFHICTKPKDDCDCWPECNSLNYEVTLQVKSAKKFMGNATLQAIIAVKMKKTNYYTTIRYSISSYKEFLAYTLGVLGAFLGFSVTCVWKMLYFGSVRLWTFVKLQRSTAISPLPQS